ncbi:MAG: TIGR01777 family protein [Gammaproteobacteria bacterium]|nr:TIGR01777 family protein [Gammaproteobacteria bacterium]
MSLTPQTDTANAARVVIAGGSGFLGRHIATALRAASFDVTVLTRGPQTTADDGSRRVNWNPLSVGAWASHLEGAAAVINLCGESIAGPRWTQRRKAVLLESREVPTRTLIDSINRCQRPPATLLQASGVGYVGTGDAELDETASVGRDFLAELAWAWERPLTELTIPSATLRFGVVLGRDGGALPPMVRPFRWFAGGPIASGEQWLSWIHIDDVTGAVQHVLDHAMTGPIHVTSPTPVRNQEFAQALGKVLRRPSCARLPRAALELLLGEQATLICDGQRALPRRLLTAGYRFRHPTLEHALRDLLLTIESTNGNERDNRFQ